ncbi:hypothetical protein TNCV_3008881 [Trichonephila clavipes]|nr:hypothetical protein TNCV_3008881 [Trichonephila clavipes]
MGSQPEALFTSTSNQSGNIHSALSNTKFPSHEDHHKPRLPDPIVATNSLHAIPQTVNFNERQAPHQRLFDMGLRTEY